MRAEAIELRPKIEVSPGFSVQSAIEKCRSLSRESALETLTGDFKFQAWEILGNRMPLSDTFYYQVKKTPDGKSKLIFECDTETETDIREVTSKEFRNGKEYRAVNAWTQVLLDQNEKLAQKRQEAEEQGEKFNEVTTILQINPKKDPNDPSDTSNYHMSQVNVALIDGSGRIEMSQLQFAGDTQQCAKYFDLIVKNPDFDSQEISNVDQMMMSIGVIDRAVGEEELLNTASFVTGKLMPSLQTIERQKAEVVSSARLAALRFYNNVTLNKPKAELERLYAKYLGQTLPKDFVSALKVKQRETGTSSAQLMVETSCGAVNLGGESNQGSILSLMGIKQEKWVYIKGDCKTCPKKDVEIGPCKMCKDCEKKVA